MAGSSQQREIFGNFKLKICLFLCLTGTVLASDVTSSATSAVNLVNNILKTTYYIATCPSAPFIIKNIVTAAVLKDPRMGASLLRLHFHDCFVQGCDASVLLKDNGNFKGEQSALPNVNSLRGFEVIDNIKTALETACPGVFSCADILAVAARDSVVVLGGPSWQVNLGRRDSTTAGLSEANSVLPSPFLDLNGLIGAFTKKGFTKDEMVALSGAHTIGRSRCLFFRSRIYNASNDIDTRYANLLKSNCPSTGGDNILSPLDITTKDTFDNAYYQNLISKRGLFHSDQQLFSGGSTNSKVTAYATNPTLFEQDFAKAMYKMSNLSPLTGSRGQIRKVCSKVN